MKCVQCVRCGQGIQKSQGSTFEGSGVRKSKTSPSEERERNDKL